MKEGRAGREEESGKDPARRGSSEGGARPPTRLVF